MKTNKNLLIAFVLYFAIALVGTATAQTLTIKGKVKFDGKTSLEKVHVAVIDLNDTSTSPKQSLTVMNFSDVLPYNGDYLVIVSSVGYQPKAIYINTHCDSVRPFKYIFEVDLIPMDKPNTELVHAGGIYFNQKKGLFDYYLTD